MRYFDLHEKNVFFPIATISDHFLPIIGFSVSQFAPRESLGWKYRGEKFGMLGQLGKI